MSLSDLRIKQAITQTGAKLFILDPLQAYIGANVDMHRANEIRPMLKRISVIAEKTGCAVIVVGHLNKGTNKSQPGSPTNLTIRWGGVPGLGEN